MRALPAPAGCEACGAGSARRMPNQRHRHRWHESRLSEVVEKSVYLMALSVLCTGIGGWLTLAPRAWLHSGTGRPTGRDGAGATGEVARAVRSWSARLDGGLCEIDS